MEFVDEKLIFQFLATSTNTLLILINWFFRTLLRLSGHISISSKQEKKQSKACVHGLCLPSAIAATYGDIKKELTLS